MIAQPCARLCLATVLLTLASASQAELRDRVMILDESYTSVRELHQLTVQSGTQILEFPDLPSSLDPASLELRARRDRLDVLSWRPMTQRSDRAAPAPVWPPSPAAVPSPVSRGWAAECDLRVRGEMTLELHYLCTNLPWSARYDLGLRLTRNPQERVLCDVRAQVEIYNPTDSVFSNSLLRLLQPFQARHEEPTVVEKAPGFLFSNSDSPLGDMWTKTSTESGIRRTYRLPDRVTLAPRESIHVTLLDAKRSKATRFYRYREGGTVGKEFGKRFHRIMRVHNTSENGLGWALPSGPVNVFAAGNRRPLAETGFLAQTEVGDYVEIDLGPAEEILFEELPQERVSRRAGQLEVRIQIRVKNELPFEVPVQWEHDPESSLQWRLLNCNVDNEVRGGILLLSSKIPSKDSRLLDFTLEFVQPAL